MVLLPQAVILTVESSSLFFLAFQELHWRKKQKNASFFIFFTGIRVGLGTGGVIGLSQRRCCAGCATSDKSSR
jgi:hypothetical protein